MSDGRDLPRARAPQTRAVWWLLGGMGLLALAVVALAPELLGDLGGLGSLMLVVVAAGLPGLLIVLVIAARRRPPRAVRDDAGRPPDGGGPPDTGA